MDRRRSWGAALGPRGPRPVRGPAFTLVALWLLLVASGRMVAGVEGVGPSKSRSGAGRCVRSRVVVARARAFLPIRVHTSAHGRMRVFVLGTRAHMRAP